MDSEMQVDRPLLEERSWHNKEAETGGTLLPLNLQEPSMVSNGRTGSSKQSLGLKISSSALRKPLLRLPPQPSSARESESAETGWSTEEASKDGDELTKNNEWVPGVAPVVPSRLSEGKHFCSRCKLHITPFVVQVGEHKYIACQTCFLDDLSELGEDLGDAEEDGKSDDEIVAEAVGDGLPEERDLEEMLGIG